MTFVPVTSHVRKLLPEVPPHAIEVLMRAVARLSSIGLVSLFLVSPLHAKGLDDVVRRYERDHAVAMSYHAAIPSFSRQTGLACSACHTAFPQLTPFGRLFKLNGYTLVTQPTVNAGDSGKAASLKLDLGVPFSAMVMTSMSQVSKTVPETQNGTVQFPQELSLFFGEAITPRIGTFLQLTYDPADGGVGIDNADIRYANHTTVGSNSLAYGVTLNNNPSVQDVWNTAPAWGFPYASSEVAPSPAASVLLDGQLGQQVAGLGAYGFWDNHLYGEFSVYRSAQQGANALPDGSSEGVVHGVAPYWRAFWHQQMGRQDLMVGTIGMSASVYPMGVTGLRNRFTDVGFDAQYERPVGEGAGVFTAHAIYMHERQQLDADVDAGAAANARNSLNTFRVDASAYSASRLGLTVGYFSTTGTVDPLRYPGGEVDGSATGSPNSNGLIFELSALPWLNTRFELQYVAYRKFNGGTTNYDGAGRSAKDNNTLYLLSWVAF
jgi:hypothetical protein